MKRDQEVENDIRQNKVKQGFLIKRSRILKEWKRRWMVLTKNTLYSFEQQAVYKQPTQKIPLKNVTNLKSYYKNQYDRNQVFRIESDDSQFYLSAVDNQQKWAWTTAIQKSIDLLKNPKTQDSKVLVRQTLRMSTALRQSTQTQNRNRISSIGENEIMKKLKLTLKSHIIDYHMLVTDLDLNMQQITSQHSLQQNEEIKYKKQTQKQQTISNNNNFEYSVSNNKQQNCKIIEKIVEKIVVVQKRIPVQIQKIVEKQKIVYVKQKNNEQLSSLSQLFTSLLNSKFQDPKPFLDFISFLTLSGNEKYQQIALKFCCDKNHHRFFSQILLQVLNEQTQQQRLNRYTAFIYIICQRQNEYFYISDLRILLQIVLRQIQYCRSNLNQMINLQLLRTITTYSRNAIIHRKNDIKSLAIQLSKYGPSQIKQIAEDICVLIQ